MILGFIILYCCFSVVPYFALADRSGFGLYPNVIDLPFHWQEWKDSYTVRINTAKDNPTYPSKRVHEREQALNVAKIFGGIFIGYFWPLALVSCILLFIFMAIKAVVVFFANFFKIIDSIKGE